MPTALVCGHPIPASLGEEAQCAACAKFYVLVRLDDWDQYVRKLKDLIWLVFSAYRTQDMSNWDFYSGDVLQDQLRFDLYTDHWRERERRLNARLDEVRRIGNILAETLFVEYEMRFRHSFSQETVGVICRGIWSTGLDGGEFRVLDRERYFYADETGEVTLRSRPLLTPHPQPPPDPQPEDEVTVQHTET